MRARTSVVAIAALGIVAMQGCIFGKDDSNDTPEPGQPGGQITVPVGTKCTDDSQCGGGRCKNNGCVPGLACVDDSVCQGAKCVDGGCVPASAMDGQKNGDETDVDCGGTVAPRCAVGQACLAGTDCNDGVCGGDSLCAAPAPNDGVKNGDETDVDCGGSSGNRCAEGKSCNVADECDSRFCTNNVCEPRIAGRQDGDETDVDCGGTVAPACAAGKACLVGNDCQSLGCDETKHCALERSCTQIHGGLTCGTGEYGQGGAAHESCCKSLPVQGYADPNNPGKTVYVDKYEITAGRMRAFIDYVSAQNGGQPNVKAWMQAHRPARWNTSWEDVLPTANTGSAINYTIKNPTTNLQYPGADQYTANRPLQDTWYVNSGSYSNDVGLYRSMGSANFFDEYKAGPNWPQGQEYAATHALNCNNSNGSYGYATYWFPDDVVQNYSGGVKKLFSKDVMDEKALNCTTFALYAAFCAWDGGQLMTAEVSDYITGNTNSPIYSAGQQTGVLTSMGGNSQCGPGGNSFITYSDGGTPCYAYFYPFIPGSETFDGSSRIAPGGRKPADAVRKVAGAEPWMDMVGNLQEAVLKSGETNRFDWRGYGNEYGSILNHRNQATTARMKGGAFGARCMRFK